MTQGEDARVFDGTKVHRLDVTIDFRNWAAMQANLSSLESALGHSHDSVLDDPTSGRVPVPGDHAPGEA